MRARIISRTESTFKIEVEVPYARSMLDGEEVLQRSLNEAGVLATKELLTQFDTDGSPINVGNLKFTAKGNREEKEFQTPYGAVKIDRFVYQSSDGGKTYVPLDINARVIGSSTPKFAMMISSKYSCDGAPGVQRDLKENHNRQIALSFIKNITDVVGTIAIAKEESWSYQLPEMPKPVSSISVGLDGTCLNMIQDGWREAMCGTIAFFDGSGDRMHTIYAAAAPEYGKKKFLDKFGHAVDNVIKLYPKIPRIGLADGAASNWTFLKEKTNILTIDFWHVTEYLAKAADVMFPNLDTAQERKLWLETACHNLKHKSGAASRILSELKKFANEKIMSTNSSKELAATITYLTNHKNKMRYKKNISNNQPIGSGVTEAACKSLVKVRMCKGSARWKDDGASVVLTLRAIHLTHERWNQFWRKYSQYGFSAAAA